MSIKEIVRFQIKKSLLPDSLLKNPKLIEHADLFISGFKKLVKLIIQKNISENSTYLMNEYKKLLNEFIKIDMLALKINMNYRLNYIITFMKMIERGEYRTTGDERVTYDSINDSIMKYTEVDYYLLISCEIAFSKLWILMDKDGKTKMAELLNNLYIRSRIIYISFIEKEYGKLYETIKIPCIIYKSSIHGKSEVVKIILTDSIIKNKDLKDEKYKAEVIKKGEEFVVDIVDKMASRGLKDDEDFNVKDVGISDKLVHSLQDVNTSIQENIKNKKTDLNQLTDIGLSLLGQYESDPEALKKMPEFAYIANYIIDILDDSKKKGLKLNPQAEKIYNSLKKMFSNSEYKISKKLQRQVQNQMKGMMKTQQVKYKYK